MFFAPIIFAVGFWPIRVCHHVVVPKRNQQNDWRLQTTFSTSVVVLVPAPAITAKFRFGHQYHLTCEARDLTSDIGAHSTLHRTKSRIGFWPRYGALKGVRTKRQDIVGQMTVPKLINRGGSVRLNRLARLLSGASAGFMPLREAVG